MESFIFYFLFLFRTYDVSASDPKKTSPGQSRQLLHSETAVMRAGLTEEQRIRLGLHRPGAVMKYVPLKFSPLFYFQ